MSRPHRCTVRRTIDAAALVLTVLAAWFLWPASLGGSNRFIVVEGQSMEPTFHLGDLVLLHVGTTPRIGNVIVFRIPHGEPAAGLLIIHRIIGSRADGTFVTQGDNRNTPDPFHIHRSDIMGSPRRSIPHLGRLIGLLSSPMIVAIAAGLLSTLLLWPRPNDRHAQALPIDLELDADGWTGVVLSEQLISEAQEWLRTQLNPVTQPAALLDDPASLSNHLGRLVVGAIAVDKRCLPRQ